MKKIYFLICALIVFSCAQPGKKNENETVPGPKIPASYAIPLKKAVAYAKYYRAKNPNGPWAFTIRGLDFIQSLGIPQSDTTIWGYKHARIYLGLDSATNIVHLLLTPVSGASIKGKKPGTDMILNGQYTGGLGDDLKGQAADDGDYVFDFTAPCPTSCANGSPLNQ
ncbi:hypothetical protein WSM22_33550 [Cytophagales bacterium WSM2-2]|nr:hypothetical protein WSM22_33550 [Cytophagales bacterium WSM2-2]